MSLLLSLSLSHPFSLSALFELSVSFFLVRFAPLPYSFPSHPHPHLISNHSSTSIMTCPYCIPGQQRCAAHRADRYQPSKRQRKRDREILREQRRLNRRPPALNPLQAPQQQLPQYFGAGQGQQHFGTGQGPQHFGTQGQQHFGTAQGPQHFGAQGPQHYGTGQGPQHFGAQGPQHYGTAQGQQHFGAQGPQYFGTAQGQQHFGAQGPQYFGTAQGPQHFGAQGPQHYGTGQGQQHFGAQGPQYFGAGQGQQHFGAQGPQYFGAGQGQQHFGTGQGPQQFGAAQGPQQPTTAQQPPTASQQPPTASQELTTAQQDATKPPTATDNKAVRTLNPRSLPFSPRKPRVLVPGHPTLPIKPPAFKQDENNITSDAQDVDYSSDWPSQLPSGEPSSPESAGEKAYDSRAAVPKKASPSSPSSSSSSEELSDDGSDFMLPSQAEDDSDSELLEELASDSGLDDGLSPSKESDDGFSNDNESGDDLSSEGDNNQAVVGADGPGVGVNGQQIEYIDIENYVPSGQALLRRKARADKFETRLKAIRNDVMRTNTVQATFAPVLLEIVDSFTAAAMEKDQEHPDVLGTTLLSEHYPPGLHVHEILSLRPGDGYNSWATDGLIDATMFYENTLYHNDLVNDEETIPGGFYMPVTTLQQYIPPYHATNEPAWDMYADRVTRDLAVHNSRLLQNELSSAFPLLDASALSETTRVVSVLHFPDHWTVFSVDLQAGRVTFIDSMPNAARRMFARSVLLKFAQLLEISMGLSIGEWTFECLAPSRQYNGEDCGFFAIANAMFLLRGQALAQCRFNRASSERYATACRWMILKRFHSLLGGTPPAQNPPYPMPGDDVVDDPVPSLEVPSTIPVLVKSLKKTELDRLRHARDQRNKSRAGDTTLDLSGVISPGSIFPHLVAGFREIIWNTLSSDRYPDGMTILELTSAIEVSLVTANRDVPDDLIDLLNHLLQDSLHHFSYSGTTLKWSVSPLQGRTLNTAFYNMLRSSKSTTALLGSTDPISSRPMLTIIVIRFSSAINKKQETELRKRFKRTMDAVDACFNPSPTFSTRPYVPEQPQFPSYVTLLLPNVRGTTSLLSMFQSDPTVNEALQQLSTQAASLRSKPIYRVVQFGLPGSSVNNDSYEELVNYYEHLDGELLIGLGPSIGRSNGGLGGFLEETLEVSNLLDWFQPFCLMRRDQLSVNHKHVLWGLYKIPVLAKRFPLWPESLQQPPTLANDLLQAIRENGENLACDKLLFLNSLMYYSRVDFRLPADRKHHQQLVASQLYVGTAAGFGAGGRNDMDLGACIPISEEISRFCRWCCDDITGHMWGRSLKEAMDDDESLTGFLCDKQECQFLELELRHRLKTEADSNGSGSGEHSPKGKKSSENSQDGSSSESGDDDDKGDAYKCKYGYDTSLQKPEVIQRRRLFDAWMHDDNGDFQILHPSDMTLAQSEKLTKTFPSDSKRKHVSLI
jgi:hypothetical protein